MSSRTPSRPRRPSRPAVARSSRHAAIDADAVLNGLGVGIVVADDHGAIQYRNTVAAAMMSAGETLDAAFAEVRFDGAFGSWSAELSRVIQQGVIARFDAAIATDGEHPPRAIQVRCSPLRSRPGEPAIDAVLLIEDADHAADSDEQVEVSRRLASLGKLAARVAHELNNQLDGILRYINLALRIAADAPEPRLQSYLAESRTGLMRMVQIISDLLQFSRSTDAGFENMGVNDVIEEAIRGNAAGAERNNVIVAADFQSRQMPTVHGSRLYQVCCNLIRNAIDAMPDGGRLTVASAVVESEVVIRVADTGVGLPEPIDQVFEPFFTTKPPGKGTGLGLAISKDFIEDMGGTITAVRGDEGGAVFTVRVPIGGFVGPVRLTPGEKREVRNAK